MKIAFYAPMKSPNHPNPSGDRRVARLLIEAFERLGHEVVLASELRTFCKDPDPVVQQDLKDQALAHAVTLISKWREQDVVTPDIWFTYHLYYKAPDHIGPLVAHALGIPYVIAEASHAPKRAVGDWVIGHEACEAALAQADQVLHMTHHDGVCLDQVVEPARLSYFPPFIDTRGFRAARNFAEKKMLRRNAGIFPDMTEYEPLLLSVAMMRPGDKLDSYRVLANSLANCLDHPWRLVVVGDGDARAQVETLFESLPMSRVLMIGQKKPEDLALLYRLSDIYVWPAIREAYGMAFLEAQASGLPVVAARVLGVPDVVDDGHTGFLGPEGDVEAFGWNIRRAIGVRRSMGRSGPPYVEEHHSIERAMKDLDLALEGAIA